ncbi:MAG: UDP-N-acetyl glucosamine 2-epimerase, partial [Saprospiraceae bacterium]
LHTAQHRDPALSSALIPGMELPIQPTYHAGSTGNLTDGIIACLQKIRPALVIIPGDTNSARAGAEAAAQTGVPLAHVEAGLRSFDPDMPEERNRIEIDRLADWYFATEPAAVRHLIREKTPAERIFLVGNVMMDLLRDVPPGNPPYPGYPVLVTFHRPANVDTSDGLKRLLRAFTQIPAPVLWPMHPRADERLGAHRLHRALENLAHVRTCPPLPYPDFIRQLRQSRLVLTDSGGLQEETTALGIPCITLRKQTERPVTVEIGTNILLPDPDAGSLRLLAQQALAGYWKRAAAPPLWDGKAAARIAQIIQKTVVPLRH